MITCLVMAVASLHLATYDVARYGAVGDGKTMCTVAIQAAIDEAGKAGKGTVVVPSGQFLTGSLTLRSHVELHLDEGATLLGSRHRRDYRRGQWFALILANRVQDI